MLAAPRSESKKSMKNKLDTVRGQATWQGQKRANRGSYRLQTKMRESHSGLWDVGVAESQESHRPILNPALRKFSVEQ